MPGSIHLAKRSLYALTVLGTLAFGASQAFATSAPSGSDAARPYCDPVKCNAACGGYGICEGFNCLCY